MNNNVKECDNDDRNENPVFFSVPSNRLKNAHETVYNTGGQVLFSDCEFINARK